MGAMKEELKSRLKQAVKCRMPLLAPPDALQYLGIERGITRGGGESNAAYAARVQRAWDSWQWAGSAFGVLSQLWAIGYTSTVILSRGTLYSLDALGQLNPPTSQTPETAPFWSRFSLVIPHPWPTWWGGTWAAPIVVGAGTGTISALAGTPNPETDYVVRIFSGGAVGAAQYQVSTDRGITFGSPGTIGASGNLLGGGPTFSASGTFTVNDRYYLSQVPPGDSSTDANIFRAVIARWKPAGVTCSAITVLKTGWLLGYPQYVWGAAHPPWGGCSTTPWTPPSG